MSTVNPVVADSGVTGSLQGSAGASANCKHEVQFYFDDRFLIQSLFRFLNGALESGSSVLVVATKVHRDALMEEFRRNGVISSGTSAPSCFVALDAAETLDQFMVDGAPDAARFFEVVGNVISCSAAVAKKTGVPVVIFGEMVALLWQRGECRSALELEKLWNQIAEFHSFHLRCAYPIASFDREIHTAMFSGLCGEHQVVIPAEGYEELAESDDKLRTIARLQQAEQVLRTEAEQRRIAQDQTLEVKGQNAQLMNEIRKREAVEEELRRFTRRLLSARDEEQRLIASELHENTAQLLAALSLYFGVLNEEKASLNPRLASIVASSRSVSDNLMNEIRKLSHLLHPPTLDDMGLIAALREHVDQFSASSGARVNLEIPDDLGRFNRKLEITVFRIVEEALGSLYPRAENAAATVRLGRCETALNVEIQCHQPAASGRDPASRAETRITGIHERVMEHGGTIRFSSDRSGILIAVTLPLETSGM